jgi:hypothetical protein
MYVSQYDVALFKRVAAAVGWSSYAINCMGWDEVLASLAAGDGG